MGIMRTIGPLLTIASFQRWATWTGTDKLAGTYLPNDKPFGSHMVGWKNMFHLDSPIMIGWTIGGRVHWKSSASTSKKLCQKEP